MTPDELIQQGREQLEMADRYATNQPSDKEPTTRALVGVGYLLLAIVELYREAVALEEERDRLLGGRSA